MGKYDDSRNIYMYTDDEVKEIVEVTKMYLYEQDDSFLDTHENLASAIEYFSMDSQDKVDNIFETLAKWDGKENFPYEMEEDCEAVCDAILEDYYAEDEEDEEYDEYDEYNDEYKYGCD